MKYAISGIARWNGITLRGGGITCTATRQQNGHITYKIKRHSKLMRKVQLMGFLLLLWLSMLPESTNTPDHVILSVIVPIGLFLLIIRLVPNLRILKYHGGEHKVVEAYRRNIPLTLETVKPLSRVTYVCGTMLIVPICLYVLILSGVLLLTTKVLVHVITTFIVFCFLGHYFFLRGVKTTYIRRLPFLKKGPYKLKSNKIYKLFDGLGYYLQERFTTREPSDDELLVAIACMKRLIEEHEKAVDF